MEENPLFIAIDANAIIHRAYHAYPPTISTTAGEQTNAVYGFTSMLLEVLKRFEPKYIVCAFDTPKPTFRHQKFADYKAHRTKPDEELIDQFPMVEKVLDAFNIPIVKREGYEADDILGAFAYEVADGKWGTQGLDMVIVSGDKDLLQLINDHVQVCLPQGSFKTLMNFDKNRTYKKYGYYPRQVVDYKAMVGDSSDNIPGIKGIGDKTARRLLEKYDSLDAIYKNIEDIDSARVKNLLTEGVEQAEISRELAEIDQDIDVGVALEDCLMRDFDKQKVLDLFVDYEFKSLINKLPESVDEQRERGNGAGNNGLQIDMFANNSPSGSNAAMESVAKDLVSDEKALSYIKELLSNNGKSVLFCYLEGEEFTDGWALFVGEGAVGKADDKAEGYVITSQSGEESSINQILIDLATSFTSGEARETYWYQWEEFTSMLRSRLSGHLDSKENLELWEGVKSYSKGVFDIKLASHLMYAGKKDYSLSALAFWHLSKAIRQQFTKSDAGSCIQIVRDISLKVIKKFNSIQKLWKAKSVGVSGLIQDNWRNLRKSYAKQLEFNENLDDPVQIQVIKNIESPVSCVLAEMENRGILLDFEKLEEMESMLADKVAKYEKKAWEMVGHEFNIASPKQLSDVIYNELGIEPVRSGKAGRSTREAILREISDQHPLIDYVLKYREVSKMHGTYVKAFIDLVKPEVREGRSPVIHTDFIQTGSSSGRFASQNPNLQNIPIVGDWADQLRETFIPRSGYVFASVDYSQIESRFMAELSKDELLMQNFIEKKDIHRATAAKIFDKDESEVTGEERRVGKTVNFGVLYGQTAFGLANQLDISREEAGRYINEYFENYSGVAEYIDKIGKTVRKLGYVETIFGRRRYISGLNARARGSRQAAIREAVNMPIQGGVSDLMKLSMLAVSDVIDEKFVDNGVPRAYMVLQVHDEFIFEVENEVIDEFGDKISQIMTDVGPNLNFEVPLEVHFASGESLGQLGK
ncbi:DNA polymerase I [Candidatus Dojkabacteria bacterium]|nr:DNA polymerase I [Candidatus Dojkabacteria bacterium]